MMLLAAESMVDVNEAMSHVAQWIPSWAKLGDGLLSFPVFSNHILMQIAAAALLVWIVPRAVAGRSSRDSIVRLTPFGLGNAIEAVCDLIRRHVAEPNMGPYAARFLPYLWSVFFFILTCNLLAMIPFGAIVALFDKHASHYVGGNPNGNIYVTAALAVMTLVLMVFNGLRYHGAAYVKHFFMGPPFMAWFIAILEVAGLFFKTMALSVRLFANMIAGHIVLAALLGFVEAAARLAGSGAAVGVAIPVIGASIAINFLELLVAFLQAFVFTLLTAVFIGMSVNIHHDEHGAHDEHAEHAPAHAGGGHGH